MRARPYSLDRAPQWRFQPILCLLKFSVKDVALGMGSKVDYINSKYMIIDWKYNVKIKYKFKK